MKTHTEAQTTAQKVEEGGNWLHRTECLQRGPRRKKPGEAQTLREEGSRRGGHQGAWVSSHAARRWSPPQGQQRSVRCTAKSLGCGVGRAEGRGSKEASRRKSNQIREPRKHHHSGCIPIRKLLPLSMHKCLSALK